MKQSKFTSQTTVKLSDTSIAITLILLLTYCIVCLIYNDYYYNDIFITLIVLTSFTVWIRMFLKQAPTVYHYKLIHEHNSRCVYDSGDDHNNDGYYTEEIAHKHAELKVKELNIWAYQVETYKQHSYN